MPDILLVAVLAVFTVTAGTLAGLGGAVILVPALVLLGWPVTEAAPLGLLSVVAGAVAAGGRQLDDRSVNHRLGVTTELLATSGAMVGALSSGLVPEQFLVVLLALVAALAAILIGLRKGTRNHPDPALGISDIGEHVGALGGAYPTGNEQVVPYLVKRLPLGLLLMTFAGLVAGSTGTSGGLLKTPITSEVMHVPIKVATATTTFTIGMTASAALAVFMAQGRLDARQGSAVVFASLIGGIAGASLQYRLPTRVIRRGLSLLLILIALVLVITL